MVAPASNLVDIISVVLFRLSICGDNPVCGSASILYLSIIFLFYYKLSGMLPVVRGWCRRSLAYEEQLCHLSLKNEYFKVKINLEIN